MWLAVGVCAAPLLVWQVVGARAAPPPPVLTPQEAAQGFNMSVSPLGLPNLPGTPLSGRAAPPFVLAIVSSARVTLRSVGGRGVVLTFVAVDGQNGQSAGAARVLERARGLLGARAQGVAMLAIAVNANASRGALNLWQRSHPGLVMLTGAPEAIKSVWTAYGVGGRGQGATLTFTPPVYVLNRDDREKALTVAAPRGISAQADALVRDIAARLG